MNCKSPNTDLLVDLLYFLCELNFFKSLTIQTDHNCFRQKSAHLTFTNKIDFTFNTVISTLLANKQHFTFNTVVSTVWASKQHPVADCIHNLLIAGSCIVKHSKA